MNGVPIRSVVIVGNGAAAWMTAAALAKTLLGLDVMITVVGAKDTRAGPGRALTSLPSLRAFHRLLGLDEDELIRATDATFSLGTRFMNWPSSGSGSGSELLHVYGDYGARLDGIDFHQHWLWQRRSGTAADFAAYAVAAQAAIYGRFERPLADPRSPLSTFGYGLNLQEHRYCDVLRAYCRKFKVEERIAQPADVRLRSEDGFIESVQLRDGGEARADLFIDCSGETALLIERALRAEREDWSELLPVDSMLRVSAPATAQPASCRTIRAVPMGWRLTKPLRSRIDQRLYYRSACTEDDSAWASLLGDVPDAAASQASLERIRPGRAKSPWLKNCVAIGGSACQLDELPATGLHLVQSAVARLIAHFPDRTCPAALAHEYNRIITNELDCVRDFAVLHYARATAADSPFWRHCGVIPMPQSLLHRVRLFAARGRVASCDADIFDAQVWVAVMLGLGIVPERLDARLENIDAAASRRSLDLMAKAVAHEVGRMREHAAVLRAIAAGAAIDG